MLEVPTALLVGLALVALFLILMLAGRWLELYALASLVLAFVLGRG